MKTAILKVTSTLFFTTLGSAQRIEMKKVFDSYAFLKDGERISKLDFEKNARVK